MVFEFSDISADTELAEDRRPKTEDQGQKTDTHWSLLKLMDHDRD